MAEKTVSMPDKQEIIRQEEELERKNKWLYPAVIIVLSVFFVVGFIYGLQSVLRMEGSFPPAVLAESKTEVPDTAEKVISYLRDVCDAAIREKPSLGTEWIFRMDEEALSLSPENKALQRTFVYLSDSVEETLEAGIETKSADFSEGIDGIFRYPEIEATDVEDFTCTYIYYKCSSCGQESQDPLDSCEYCGSEYPYLMEYREQYSFDVRLKVSDQLAEKLFTPGVDEILPMLNESLTSYYSLSDLKTDLKGLLIHFETNRLTDELTTIRYAKETEASFTLTDEAGVSTNVVLPVSTRSDFNMVWPALKLNAHTKVLEPKGTDNLLADRICSDPVAYTATWSSSDENVVTVDEEGYLKAAKTPGEATVTATFSFNGKEYSDTCKVFVRVPVESMQLNKRHLSLSVGDSAVLTAKVSPKKATVQTATFYSTDESVATVSDDGTVTAVSAGTATVYGLSDDGYYKSSCEVTVK